MPPLKRGVDATKLSVPHCYNLNRRNQSSSKNVSNSSVKRCFSMNSTVDQQSKCRRRNLLSTTQLFQDLVMFQMLSQVLRSFHHVSRLNKCGKWQCYLSQTFEEEPLKFNMDASNRQTSKVFFHCLNESYRLRVQKHLRIRASQDLATAAPKGARGRA